MKAILMLEDGTVFDGQAFGAMGCQCGEVVFNTSMTGYQEILTDPSYHEQIITMTYPLIGNTGTNQADWESSKVFARGFVVKECCQNLSSWRSNKDLDGYLKSCGTVGIAGIDTRMLVRHIRQKGAMRGIISSTILRKDQAARQLELYPGLVGRDIVKDVTTKQPYLWQEGPIDIFGSNRPLETTTRFNVVAMDFGTKRNILRRLVAYGCRVMVVPANTTAQQILKLRPDGVFLSNGPGDPAALPYAVETLQGLLGKVPLFGICLGHKLLGLALGGRTYKLKFGHHGSNHPVKDIRTGRVEITSQNHGFCVDIESLRSKKVQITHINLNDQTLEGISASSLGAFSVQYHPEASPGPHDCDYLFAEFVGLMQEG